MKKTNIDKKELTQKIEAMVIPVKADSVLSPNVYYDTHKTAIYFLTEEENHARITFENLDAIKVSRGEMLPLAYDWRQKPSGAWTFVVKNSAWLEERYAYEKKHYGDSYEFNGDVEDMKKYFSHYIFSFHDQFVEVIARGFWAEESEESLFGKDLTQGHPFNRLSNEKSFVYEWHGLVTEVCETMVPQNELIENTRFCRQTILECYLDKKSERPPHYSLVLSRQGDEIVSEVCGYFSAKEASFSGVASFEDIEPYLQKYMEEVAQRRNSMKPKK